MLIFCFFLFNDKKKARPAGHNQLAGTAKTTLGASRKKKSRAGRLIIAPTKGTKGEDQGPGRTGARPTRRTEARKVREKQPAK
ncbi:MAG: hypothetical protein FWE28_07715 [Oscillospiraceae bacterium]|nr:hypothetical protein [Oscillospiraceae bacterium]